MRLDDNKKSYHLRLLPALILFMHLSYLRFKLEFDVYPLYLLWCHIILDVIFLYSSDYLFKRELKLNRIVKFLTIIHFSCQCLIVGFFSVLFEHVRLFFRRAIIFLIHVYNFMTCCYTVIVLFVYGKHLYKIKKPESSIVATSTKCIFVRTQKAVFIIS